MSHSNKKRLSAYLFLSKDTLKVWLPICYKQIFSQNPRIRVLTENLKLLPLSNFTLSKVLFVVKQYLYTTMRMMILNGLFYVKMNKI